MVGEGEGRLGGCLKREKGEVKGIEEDSERGWRRQQGRQGAFLTSNWGFCPLALGVQCGVVVGEEVARHVI